MLLRCAAVTLYLDPLLGRKFSEIIYLVISTMEGTFVKPHKIVKTYEGTQKFERIIPTLSIILPDILIISKVKVNF